jgi:hypothetical protein
MKRKLLNFIPVFFILILTSCGWLSSQTRGLKAISEQDLKYHLEFIAAPEFRGRQTPSYELEIATLYIGHWAEYIGLKPVLGDGSFFQTIPYELTFVVKNGTKMKVVSGNEETSFDFGKAFGGNFSGDGEYTGEVIFAGYGLSAPEQGWDDLRDLDIDGKIVLILDAKVPGRISSSVPASESRLLSRVSTLQKLGAIAVFSVIVPEREDKLSGGSKIFEYTPGGRMLASFDSQRTSFGPEQAKTGLRTQVPSRPFVQAEISHEIAGTILGKSKSEITDMFRILSAGQQVPSSGIPGIHVRLDIQTETVTTSARNVIGMVEGTDPVLKNEYVVVCAHHDHIGIRYGEIIAGADDNGSGTVALMGVARGLLAEKPKRSVILAWFTGEERGMHGSHYFINNAPVPVEKISACINLDMLGRNPSDSLFLIGSDLMSTELDDAINKVNKQYGINFGFDYRYSDPNHPQRVYFRSDQYPFVRFGIPSVWVFCGFTPDYHTPGDVLEYIDYHKLFRSAKLVYLTAVEIGNMKELLKLDVNPAVTSRGKHNLKEKSLFQGSR